MAEPSGNGRWDLLRSRAARTLFVAVPLLWLVLGSFWIVREDEDGVVTRFGRVDRVVASGFRFTLPWPFERMERVATTEVRTIAIGLGATGEEDEDDDVQWMTGDTNIVEMRVVVQYVVRDPDSYLYSVADFPDGRSRDLLIEQAARAELTRLVACMTVDEVLSVGKARLQLDAKVGTQSVLDDLDLGLDLLTVNIAAVHPPPQVITAFNDVASAESDKERVISEADGFRRDLLPTERGRANTLIQNALVYQDQVVKAARGAASRFLQLAEEVRACPGVSRHRLWLDTVADVLGRVESVVYSTEDGKDFRYSVVE